MSEVSWILTKGTIAACLIVLILATSLSPSIILATDPGTIDLSGTNSSDYDSTTTSTLTSSSADSYLSSKYLDTNYGSATTMDVGYGSSPWLRRAIVKFDLTSISSYAYVNSSQVSLYPASFYQAGGLTISVHRVQQSPARAWTEAGVTWNRYDGTNSWTTVGGDFNGTATSQTAVSSAGSQYYNWTATYDVRNFVQTPSTNYGWIFKSTTEASKYAAAINTKEATSNKPKIYVTYISSQFDIVGKTWTGGLQVYGLQAGSDSNSLAIAMRLGNIVGDMGLGAKYEINFTIGAEDFSMMLVGSGAGGGYLKICYKAHGTSTWYDGESTSISTIVSGTRYTSASGNTAVKVTESNPSAYGWVKLEANRAYLSTLGATGYSVTDIDGITYQGSSVVTLRPGAQGGTKKDRCPSGSSYTTYTMVVVPEFPFGLLFLVIPVMIVQLYLRKRLSQYRTLSTNTYI